MEKYVQQFVLAADGQEAALSINNTRMAELGKRHPGWDEKQKISYLNENPAIITPARSWAQTGDVHGDDPEIMTYNPHEGKGGATVRTYGFFALIPKM